VSILTWLKRAFVPPKLVDRRFGNMTYQRVSKQSGQDYWEGAGRFAGREVEYFVDGEESGPTDAQRALCDVLEQNWAAIESRLASYLERNATEEEFGDRPRQLAGYSLGSFAIPVLGTDAPRYTVGYVEIDGGELLDFEMIGFEPRSMQIGG